MRKLLIEVIYPPKESAQPKQTGTEIEILVTSPKRR